MKYNVRISGAKMRQWKSSILIFLYMFFSTLNRKATDSLLDECYALFWLSKLKQSPCPLPTESPTNLTFFFCTFLYFYN